MFGFLRKTVEKAAVSILESEEVKESPFKGKTEREIIEAIHNEFETEVDRLLAEANIMNSLESDKEDLVNKGKRLKELGFGASKDVSEANEEEERLRKLENENREKKILAEAINYFSQKYPFYKFITEDSVKKICEKYNLVYSKASRYVGDIPEKNIEDMENFKISEDDACYFFETIQYSSYDGRAYYIDERYISKTTAKEECEKHKPKSLSESISNTSHTIDKCPLEIVAPIKDFNLNKSEMDGFRINDKIEIPDPVVLQPVHYKGKKHYLVVTAWGLEASDELVVNEKLN